MQITRYSALFNTAPSETADQSWSEVTHLLSQFVSAPSKFSVGGFGGHVLQPPTRPCTDHTEHGRSVTKADAHRCERCVVSVTLFVFDVDAGTPEDIGECERLLRQSNLAAHFYSSHSHTATKPALRLVLPPSRAMSSEEYPGLRARLIHDLKIPCKPEQSGDSSRFWFLPSHRPGATPIFETLGGNPVDVDALTPLAIRPRRSNPNINPLSTTEWSPPPEPPPGTPFDMRPIREALEGRASRLAKQADAESKQKAVWLRRLLAGEALADHGQRNETTARVCGVTIFALPTYKEIPVSIFMNLIRPSLNAMVRAGSKLTEEKVERMFVSALKKRAANSLDIEQFRRLHLERKAALVSSLKGK